MVFFVGFSVNERMPFGNGGVKQFVDKLSLFCVNFNTC